MIINGHQLHIYDVGKTYIYLFIYLALFSISMDHHAISCFYVSCHSSGKLQLLIPVLQRANLGKTPRHLERACKTSTAKRRPASDLREVCCVWWSTRTRYGVGNRWMMSAGDPPQGWLGFGNRWWYDGWMLDERWMNVGCLDHVYWLLKMGRLVQITYMKDMPVQPLAHSWDWRHHWVKGLHHYGGDFLI